MTNSISRGQAEDDECDVATPIDAETQKGKTGPSLTVTSTKEIQKISDSEPSTENFEGSIDMNLSIKTDAPVLLGADEGVDESGAPAKKKRRLNDNPSGSPEFQWKSWSPFIRRVNALGVIALEMRACALFREQAATGTRGFLAAAAASSARGNLSFGTSVDINSPVVWGCGSLEETWYTSGPGANAEAFLRLSPPKIFLDLLAHDRVAVTALFCSQDTSGFYETARKLLRSYGSSRVRLSSESYLNVSSETQPISTSFLDKFHSPKTDSESSLEEERQFLSPAALLVEKRKVLLNLIASDAGSESPSQAPDLETDSDDFVKLFTAMRSILGSESEDDSTDI